MQRGEGPLERQRSLRWEERLGVTQSSLASQEPILALRRQLASLSGAAAEAGECWLQLAQLCRGTGHYEAATTAVLEAVASRVPSAPLEQLRLLWDKGQPYRAVSEAHLLAGQARERRLAAPFAKEAEHSLFHAQVALQLAQWMAETGQGAKEEIVGERGWAGGWAVCEWVGRWVGGQGLASGCACLDPALPCPAPHATPCLPAPADLFERATSLEPKSETVLFRYAVYLDEASVWRWWSCGVCWGGGGGGGGATEQDCDVRTLSCACCPLPGAGGTAQSEGPSLAPWVGAGRHAHLPGLVPARCAQVMTDARRRQEVERERGDRLQKGMDRLQGMARIKVGEAGGRQGGRGGSGRRGCMVGWRGAEGS